MQKQIAFKIKGMQRDFSESAFNPQYSYENKNIRIMATKENTMLSIVNEKGTKLLTIDMLNNIDDSIKGTPLGQTVLGDYFVLFTHDTDADYIYRFNFSGSTIIGIILFKGNLNFNPEYPIEALPYYENDKVQKIYWTDGHNQPRVINILATSEELDSWIDTSFDFTQTLSLVEDVEIIKNISSTGEFLPGVIQYCFSYFNNYRQESNIFYTSPLYYLSHNGRGASPEDKVSNSFNITIDRVDRNFNYVRIYSIHRSSINATPTVKIVTDIYISSDSILFTDNGIVGVTIDPTKLLFIGGESIICKTMTHKDNTLFLGNISLNKTNISTTIKNYFYNKLVMFTNGKTLPVPTMEGNYAYIHQLYNNSEQIKTFKYLDWYRFGVQFQYKTGKWSEPVFMCDRKNNIKINTTNSVISNDNIVLPKGTYRLNDITIINNLISAGFVKVRPVVVYPTLNDREVLCQGIINPTVYNVEDRLSNSPFAQASWFIRPNAPFEYVQNANPIYYNLDNLSGNGTKSINSKGGYFYNDYSLVSGYYINSVTEGSTIEFRHDKFLPINVYRNSEIQCINVNPSSVSSFNSSGASLYKSSFGIDQSIVTLHSPELEFDESIQNIDMSSYKLRIVGAVPITANSSDINITTSSLPYDIYATGFYKEPINNVYFKNIGSKGLVSSIAWIDKICYPTPNSSYNPATKMVGYLVYPWHRNGSLNNARVGSGRSAVLDKKHMSNLRYSYNSYYLDSSDIWNAYVSKDAVKTGISGAVIFNSEEQSLIKINAPSNSTLDSINYYGNVDRVIVPSQSYNHIITSTKNTNYDNNRSLFLSNLEVLDSNYSEVINSKDPVRITYKSTPHAVLALNYTTSNAQRILPTTRDNNIVINDTASGLPEQPFWSKVAHRKSQDYIDLPNISGRALTSNIGYGFLWLGELYNDNISNRFGGTNEEAFAANEWVVCGEAKSLFTPSILYAHKLVGFSNVYTYTKTLNPVANVDHVYNNLGVQVALITAVTPTYFTITGGFQYQRVDSLNDELLYSELNPVTSIDIDWVEGDTYYQRYDHLKTYPFTSEDQNSMVEIISFMCESRINLDGRYDRNRGQKTNLTITPTNFNLLNNTYSQNNNYFKFPYVNSNKLNIDNFPNLVTWTLSKTSGELIDTWTNITLAATLELDGDRGTLNSLKRFNNELLAFQDKGISAILYNTRTQLSTVEGVPIEIANSGKVDGKRYISNVVGCTNKWSITESPNGLYFIDDLSKSIYLFNGQLLDISDKFGFHSWINTYSENKVWNPSTFDNIVTYYDRTNGDVHFITKDTCLTFSEPLSGFSSFYSYENAPYFFTIGDRGLWINKAYNSNDYKIWEHTEGDYNMFFGQYKPFWTTVIANPDPQLDKIFNILEFKADSFNSSGTYLPLTTFDKLYTWNEYQSGDATLVNTKDHVSNLKKKFNVWRTLIPRDTINHRDRMRNPWLYVKLAKETVNTDKTVLHDMVVSYFD